MMTNSSPNSPPNSSPTSSLLSDPSVTFTDIAESYPSDGDVYCRYVFTKGYTVTEGDEVAVFRVGSLYDRMTDALACKPVSSAIEEANGDHKIIFPAALFAGKINEDSSDPEFLQFCYVSGPNLRGASTPFKIFRPKEEDMIESQEDVLDDGDFVVLKSKDAQFQEQMDKLRSEKGVIAGERDVLKARLDTVMAQLREKEERQGKLKKDLLLVQTELQTLTSSFKTQTGTFHRMLAGKDEQIGKLNDEQKELQATIMALNNETIRLEDEKKEAVENERDTENVLSCMTDKLKEEEKKVNELHGQVFTLINERYNCNVEAEKLTAASKTAEKMAKSLKEELDTVKERADSDKRMCESLEQQLVQEKAKYTVLSKSARDEKEELQTNLDAAKKTVDSLSTSLEKAVMERDSRNKAVCDLEKKVSELTLRLKAAESEYEKLAKEKGKVDMKYQRLQDKVNAFLQTRTTNRSVSASEATTSAAASPTVARAALEKAIQENLDQTTAPKQVAAFTAGPVTQAIAAASSDGVFEAESVVSIPCTMCGDVISCNAKNMSQMAAHLETAHNQRMCPVCSALFDTTVSGFEDYLRMHVENHFSDASLPNE